MQVPLALKLRVSLSRKDHMHVDVMGGRARVRKRCSVIVAAALGFYGAIAVQRAAAQVCVGDCGGKGSVGISDLVQGVNIALGNAPVSQCPEFDANGDGKVEINEIIAGVNNALGGQCSPAKPPTQPAATHTASGGTPTRPAATPTTPGRTPTGSGTTPTVPGATATPTSTTAGGRFVDSHDGTITDTQTGLMWEKKVGLGVVNPANPHNATNTYTWAGQCSSAAAVPCQPDADAANACAAGLEGNPNPTGCATCQAAQGTCTSGNAGALATIWDWLVQLNAGSGFAGHTDWRIPTESELGTIIDFTSSTNPPVDPAFQGATCGIGCVDANNPACSCTNHPLGFYVSSSGRSGMNAAWGIFYPNAIDPSSSARTVTTFVPFTAQSSVRAVRGGSVAAPRFTDNGDGTITDHRTNLTWEKKVQRDGNMVAGNLQDADNTYPWSCTDSANAPCQPTAEAASACSAGVEGNGSACAQCSVVAGACSDTVWTWLTALNAAGFAGHSDWRIPTVEEVQSVVLYTGVSPPIDPAFEGAMCNTGTMCTDITLPKCSCTNTLLAYWSATISAPPSAFPWEIKFDRGFVDAKTGFVAGNFVRAVRGGK
jgi:hypothetical protein